MINKPLVPVVAAVLVNDSGDIFLAQRPKGKHMEGLWEFPGGKIDPGETPEDALVRELQEELGIEVSPESLKPFTFSSHSYDTFHLCLLVYMCKKWEGIPQGREGQNIVFAPLNSLSEYEFPPADVDIVLKLERE